MSSTMEIGFSFYIFLSAGICALVVMLLCIFLKPKKFAAGRAIAAAACSVVLIVAGIVMTVSYAGQGEDAYQTQTFTASYSSVSLSCRHADVIVTQGDGNSLTLTLPRTDDFSVEEDGGELFVTQQTRFPFGWLSLRTQTVTLTLPAGGIEGITILTGAGDVRAEDVRAEDVIAATLTVGADTGDVTITGGTAVSLSVSADAGDISVASFTADSLHAATDTGDIAVENATVSALLKADTYAGDITLASGTAGQIEATTNAGDIYLSAVTAASITATADDGNIGLDYAKADAFFLITDVGSIGGVIQGIEDEYTVSVQCGFGNGNIAEKTVTTGQTLVIATGVGGVNISFTIE